MNPALILFDIDGTLTQSVDADAECFLRALEDEFGLREINDDWSLYPHCTDSGILATIFQERRGRTPTSAETAEVQSHFLALLAAVVAIIETFVTATTFSDESSQAISPPPGSGTP